MRCASLWALVLLLLPSALAVKTQDFKTCSQAGFCRRGRALASRASEAPTWTSPYLVDASTIALASGQAAFTASVRSSIYPDIKFALDVRIHEDGVVRVRMDEVDGLRKRYDQAAQWALIEEPRVADNLKWAVDGKRATVTRDGVEVVVDFAPLKVTLLRGGKEQVVLNGRGLLHMEHFRKKVEKVEPEKIEGADGAQAVIQEPENPRAWFEGDSEDGYWEETFNSWTDSKPKGPESLSLDITFPRHGHAYGIPQHAAPLDLPLTTGPGARYSDPYRLWNSDVFEYAADGTMSLYGSIPLLHAHSTESTVAVFNAVGSETFIDIGRPKPDSTETHWISESGILDVFIIPGPTPEDVFKQYARLTGATVMPAQWALGYHQCRWNYVSSNDVRNVQRRFDEEDIPVDVFWLDIDYSPDHKYFIWKEKEFPDPVEMFNDVSASGRKMVVIIDPHLKRDQSYPPYNEASERGLLVKPSSGEGEYEGWCWPGSSSWVDMFNPASWTWWAGLFKTTPQNTFSWTTSTEDVHIWNDMNEPSVFNGPEISMPRDNVHYEGWEHRDVHNINGMLFSNATYTAVLARSDYQKRPFVLTRSFYAGSQRFGAMWTGDNLGTWEHMDVGSKMVLSNSIAGMAFAGSDVGGFFGNPEPEMLVRWYQVGAFNPFFRAHAHIDTKRREPYLLDDPYKSMVKEILRLRYSLLPVWYTAFHETSVSGLPIVRPHYVVFPKDEAGFSLDDQWFVGSSGLLVKPVTQAGVEKIDVYLPEDQVYYDYVNLQTYRGAAKGVNVTVAANLDRTPLLIRGGSIIPVRLRPRRSAPLMKFDPFTLRVALDNTGVNARGELYLDDGETYAYRQGEFVWREFKVEKHGKDGLRLSSVDLAAVRPSAEVIEGGLQKKYDTKNAYAEKIAHVGVEKIEIYGLAKAPKSVKLEDGTELIFEFFKGVAATESRTRRASSLEIKRPDVSITKDWAIIIE